jgi:hypothetical protein
MAAVASNLGFVRARILTERAAILLIGYLALARLVSAFLCSVCHVKSPVFVSKVQSDGFILAPSSHSDAGTVLGETR